MAREENHEQTERLREEVAQLRGELEGLRIALTWLAPFVQMDREDRDAALQGAREEVSFSEGEGKLAPHQTGKCLMAATGVLSQAGAFCYQGGV